jgi:hypothetical protein
MHHLDEEIGRGTARAKISLILMVLSLAAAVRYFLPAALVRRRGRSDKTG